MPTLAGTSRPTRPAEPPQGPRRDCSSREARRSSSRLLVHCTQRTYFPYRIPFDGDCIYDGILPSQTWQWILWAFKKICRGGWKGSCRRASSSCLLCCSWKIMSRSACICRAACALCSISRAISLQIMVSVFGGNRPRSALNPARFLAAISARC